MLVRTDSKKDDGIFFCCCTKMDNLKDDLTVYKQVARM